VLKRTDPRGVESHFKYDSLNRPTKVWYTGLGGDDLGTVRPALPSTVEATADIDITYKTTAPGNGAVASIVDTGGSESYTYDGFWRLTSKSHSITGNTNTYTTSYEYNQFNQQTAVIYPSGKPLRTSYDARGRLIRLDKMNGATVAQQYLSSIAYNTAGQVTQLKLGNTGTQTTENYTYSADRLQSTGQSVVNSGGTTLMNLTYSYQAAPGASGVGTGAGNSGQLMSITGTINGQSRAQSFTYDDVGRLVTATGWGAWQRRFEYDRWGNRTGVWDATVGGTQIQSIALQQQAGSSPVAPSNRMQTVTQAASVLTQQYDAAGNLINDGVHAYRYDAEDRLVKVDAGTANEAVYSYDANNWRVKKVVGTGASAVTTYYVWEGAVVIAEYSTAPASGPGGLRFYHPDRLSTRMITDASGVVRGTQDHLPFGEDAGTVGETEKHRFTNYERDPESGTDYAVNRQYAAASGRYTRPDPVPGNILDTQSMNRYSYVLNDPVNLTDPSGLESLFGPFMDASVRGPGVYLDGAAIFPEQYGMAFNLVRIGAAGISVGVALRITHLFTLPGHDDGPPEGGPVEVYGYELVNVFVTGLSQNPASQNPPCPPTGSQLANDPAVVRSMRQAWRESRIGTRNGVRREHWLRVACRNELRGQSGRPTSGQCGD